MARCIILFVLQPEKRKNSSIVTEIRTVVDWAKWKLTGRGTRKFLG